MEAPDTDVEDDAASDIGGSGGSPTPLLLFPDPPIMLDGRGGGPF